MNVALKIFLLYQILKNSKCALVMFLIIYSSCYSLVEYSMSLRTKKSKWKKRSKSYISLNITQHAKQLIAVLQSDLEPLIRTTQYLHCAHTAISGLHTAHPASNPIICICIINLNNRR